MHTNDEILDEQILQDEQEENGKPAGFWIRVGAALIDLVVYLPLLGLNLYSIYFLKSFPLDALIVAVIFLYKPLMEYKYGATLGKMALKIKVVNSNFNSISLQQSFVRFIPWGIGQIISFYGTILLFSHPDFQHLTGFEEIAQLQASISTSRLDSVASIFAFVAGISVAFNPAKQGIHDKMARTFCRTYT